MVKNPIDHPSSSAEGHSFLGGHSCVDNQIRHKPFSLAQRGNVPGCSLLLLALLAMVRVLKITGYVAAIIGIPPQLCCYSYFRKILGASHAQNHDRSGGGGGNNDAVALSAVGIGLLAASPAVRANYFGHFWLAIIAHSDAHHELRSALLNQLLTDHNGADELRILEIGPGEGVNLAFLAQRSAEHGVRLRWEGMEPNPVLFDALQQRIATLNSSLVSGTSVS
jgi:hypothetical protein